MLGINRLGRVGLNRKKKKTSNIPTLPTILYMAVFDGTNDNLLRGGALTGLADGQQGTLSVWVKSNGGDGVAQVLLGSALSRVQFQKTASNQWQFFARNSSGTNILVHTHATSQIAGSSIRHLLISFDLNAGVSQYYQDDVSAANASTLIQGGTIDYDVTNWAIGSTTASGSKINGEIGELWFSNTYIDLSVSANRQKFRSSGGIPVNLGSDGSTPTGLAPLIYLSHRNTDVSAASFATNRGAGGNFNITGSLDTGGSLGTI